MLALRHGPARAEGERENGVNWWSVMGLVSDIIGVVGVGFEAYLWTKSAPIDAIPGVPATTRFGLDEGYSVDRPMALSRGPDVGGWGWQSWSTPPGRCGRVTLRPSPRVEQ